MNTQMQREYLNGINPKGKKTTKKKSIARRKTVGAKAPSMDDYKKCTDFFHFNVDTKECVDIIKTPLEKLMIKKKQKSI